MVKRAQSWPEGVAAQLEAVQKFRLPYYDYFRPRDYETTFPGVTTKRTVDRQRNIPGFDSFPFDFAVPQIFTLERVIVQEPINGQLRKSYIQNPLRSFWFPLENGMTAKDWEALGPASVS